MTTTLRRGVRPPISVVLARDKDRYLKGLTLFREDRLADWIELFAAAAAGRLRPAPARIGSRGYQLAGENS